jgi:hypothetical protein
MFSFFERWKPSPAVVKSTMRQVQIDLRDFAILKSCSSSEMSF